MIGKMIGEMTGSKVLTYKYISKSNSISTFGLHRRLFPLCQTASIYNDLLSTYPIVVQDTMNTTQVAYIKTEITATLF
jgi:hypothetical protein